MLVPPSFLACHLPLQAQQRRAHARHLGTPRRAQQRQEAAAVDRALWCRLGGRRGCSSSHRGGGGPLGSSGACCHPLVGCSACPAAGPCSARSSPHPEQQRGSCLTAPGGLQQQHGAACGGRTPQHSCAWARCCSPGKGANHAAAALEGGGSSARCQQPALCGLLLATGAASGMRHSVPGSAAGQHLRPGGIQPGAGACSSQRCWYGRRLLCGRLQQLSKLARAEAAPAGCWPACGTKPDRAGCRLCSSSSSRGRPQGSGPPPVQPCDSAQQHQHSCASISSACSSKGDAWQLQWQR